MDSTIRVLNKILAREFYRMNSGFFLFIGTLTFGFMSGIEHKALAEYFVSAPNLLLVPIGIWILYTGKILSFNVHEAYQPQNRILFNLPFLSRGRQWRLTLQCFVLQFLPALGYGAFLCVMALRMGTSQSVLLIIVTLMSCCVAGSAYIIEIFRNPHREQSVSFFKRFLDNRYQKPVLQFYTEWLLRNRTLQVAGIKVFNGALVWGVCRLYSAENYDWRLLAMAISASSVANLPIIFHLSRFEHVRMGWIKNLPLALSRRYLHLASVAIIFLVPESVVLIRNFPDPLGMHWMALTVVYGMSLGLLLTGFVLLFSSGLEHITKRYFWIFIGLLVLILFKTPLALLCFANACFGYLCFSRCYYAFEPYQGR